MVADVWVVGTAAVADAVEVCLKELREVEERKDDVIGLEYT